MSGDIELYGRCHELSMAAVAADPSLTLVRGWYYCPVWGEREHWWTTRPDGTVFDPTAAQFPSGGLGHYEPFAGTFPCEHCGEAVAEAVAYIVAPHVYCSYRCYGRDIGF